MTNFTVPFCVLENDTKEELFCVNEDGTVSFAKSISLPIREVSADTTVSVGDYFINCDASAAAITVTLTTAAASTGRSYIIKKIDGTANTVTIDPVASETIDTSASEVISTQFDARSIICDGTQWWIY